jgi:hypothetical protein
MRTRWNRLVAAIGALACAAASAPGIHVEDVERFYNVYDAADGRPSAEQLQRDYLDPGSEGLHRFARMRNITGARIADALTKNPSLYANARRCMAVLPQVQRRVEVALGKLIRLYPEARLPPVTIAVGRGKPVGVGSPQTGVQIGLEALCATDFMNPDIEDRFVYVIAHEYVHVQQAQDFTEDKNPTVLSGSLMEGSADFVGELISGSVSYAHLAAMTQGREKEIETAFVADQDKSDVSDWINNSTPEKPGDLGYWVGYRIVKSYYQRASDQRRALREILEMKDPKAFLARSGWYPGMQFQDSPCSGSARVGSSRRGCTWPAPPPG